MVVVGAGGAGKTETILLAMANTQKSKADWGDGMRSNTLRALI